MIRVIDRKQEPTLFTLIAVLMVIPFVADLMVPLGVAAWVIYILPIGLSFLTWRPQAPFVLAALSTAFMAVGYLLSPSGIDADIAVINRGFGIFTAWIMGITGYFFIRNKVEVHKQEWLQAGEVGLSQTMSGELALDQLGDNILRYLAEYLGAAAGVIFMQNGAGYARKATYAMPSGASIPDVVDVGDGLIGQAIKDRRSFEVRDLPHDYLYFGSSMGRAKPNHVLIAPLGVDNEVNGVLELGFAEDIEPASLELLERVSPAIGTAIRSAKYRARLRELLEETQRQAEELQTQSEELRASNEELEEQSRALLESQARLEQQQAELEQSNSQLEEQTQMLETQRDDLQKVQATLQSQAIELERASRYKSEFVANMSHELRTPLNSLLIMARLLADNRDANLSDDQVKYAQTIEASGNDLLNLINDILDISKIEAGHLEIEPQEVRTSDIVDKLRTAFDTPATQKGLDLRVEIGDDVPARFETDRQRLEQVLKNFLSNAVKFTERGEVVLSVEKVGEEHIGFRVRDTGIGIPEEQQAIIFEAFRQADGTINRKYGGTGLGLSISRELAQLLGGEIQVESTQGKGSVFSLIVPIEFSETALDDSRPNGRVPAAPIIVQKPNASKMNGNGSMTLYERPKQVEDDREHLSGSSRVILAVEDDPDFARILIDLAHELGFQCLVAETAEEGVLLARQYLPHAVVLDMGLPDHTGLSVLDRLKRDVRTRHIPVHVVSASDYTQMALSYGAVSYMLKPVKRDELSNALEQLEVRLAQRMRQVLIVEDDKTQLESLGLLLGSRDVETVGARSAAECLEKLRVNTFDCMVLDLSLPDASGFDVLEQLHEDDSFSFPPVIVYTGRDLSPDEELRLRKYSKSIIIKGAKSPERLLDEVTLFLHQVVSDLPPKQQRMLTQSLNRDSTLEGRSILVVEDDVRNVFSLTSIFEPHGVNVEIARNGKEALTALERLSTDGGNVDLVLMDVMMPEMDGLTATREIRRRPDWRNLPIIMLTAKAMAEDHQQCLEAGANDYLPKPLDVDKLLSLVRVWMPR